VSRRFPNLIDSFQSQMNKGKIEANVCARKEAKSQRNCEGVS
jgi:hypothetical protein